MLIKKRLLANLSEGKETDDFIKESIINAIRNMSSAELKSFYTVEKGKTVQLEDNLNSIPVGTLYDEYIIKINS